MIYGRNFFDHPVINYTRTYNSIQKIATGQGDIYTGCFLDYLYFKKYYMMISTDLSKQQASHADPRAIQQVNFIGNLDQGGNTTMSFVIEEVNKTVLDFSKGTVRVF